MGAAGEWNGVGVGLVWQGKDHRQGIGEDMDNALVPLEFPWSFLPAVLKGIDEP